MITHTPLVAGNLPIQTLVARQWPTSMHATTHGPCMGSALGSDRWWAIHISRYHIRTSGVTDCKLTLKVKCMTLSIKYLVLQFSCAICTLNLNRHWEFPTCTTVLYMSYTFEHAQSIMVGNTINVRRTYVCTTAQSYVPMLPALCLSTDKINYIQC